MTNNSIINLNSLVSSTTSQGKLRRYSCGDFSAVENSMRIFSIVLFCITFIFGVIGNGLVIWVTGFKMKKTVNTVWFLNLAIADFIFTFFLPLTIAYIMMRYHWPFGSFFCKINSTIGILNMYASVFFLMVISMDRFVATIYPVWSQNHRTPKLATIVALVIWFLAIIMSCPSLAFRDTGPSPRGNPNITICYLSYAVSFNASNPNIYYLRMIRSKIMTMINFVCGFLIPITVVIICYSCVALKIKRNRLAKSSKPFRIIIAIIVSFFLCWFPFHVFNILERFGRQRHSCQLTWAVKIGMTTAVSLAYLNSCVNPFLYVIMGQDFKDRLKVSIFSMFEKAFTEESTHLNSIPVSTEIAHGKSLEQNKILILN